MLITGGAGFVGANLAIALAERHPDWHLPRSTTSTGRGSELNLARLREAGVEFVHGDVRERGDLTALGRSTRSSSARPSRRCWPGMGSGADFVVQTNLLGAYNCLELARRDGAQFVFLSTSRVYPVAALSRLALERGRDALRARRRAAARRAPRQHGIAEDFPLGGARTLYGATKLAAELLIAEYASAFGVRAVIDRCGVIAGPWQMGKVDQGVFTHWLLAPPLRAAAHLHRLRRRGQAGARPAARRRPRRR